MVKRLLKWLRSLFPQHMESVADFICAAKQGGYDRVEIQPKIDSVLLGPSPVLGLVAKFQYLLEVKAKHLSSGKTIIYREFLFEKTSGELEAFNEISCQVVDTYGEKMLCVLKQQLPGVIIDLVRVSNKETSPVNCKN